MTLRAVLIAIACFAIVLCSCPAGAQIDASVRDQPEVSREDIDSFIERTAMDPAAAELVRAMHETYQNAYGEAWQAFRADFERDQRAAFEAGDRGDEAEHGRLGESLRAQVASWRRERSRLLQSYLYDSALALPEPEAAAWDRFSQASRRARIMEELDPHAIDHDLFDLEGQIEMIDLNDEERGDIDELLDEYRSEMDEVIISIEARVDAWYDESQDPELDEESRARISAELEQWRDRVRTINKRVLPLAAAAMVEHRPEFDALESGRRNPALFMTSPVDRVMTVIREADILPADQMQTFGDDYESYMHRRAGLRRQFLQAHARWQRGTEERWAQRDEAIRRAEEGERIDVNASLHGHPGVPAMAAMFTLEESTLAGMRRQLSDDELDRLSLEVRILLGWPR